MRRIELSRVAESFLLLFLVLVILWKGGKSVDATWLLALMGGWFGLLVVFDAESKPRPSPWVFWPLVLFVLWTIISYVTSTTRNYGLDEVLQTAALACIFFRVAGIEGRSFHLNTARAVAIATLLASGIGTAVYIFQPVSRFVGSFFDARFHTDYWPNAWAEYLLLAWPLLLFVLFRNMQSSRSKQWMKGLIFGFVLAAGLLSYSRGAVLSLGLQAVFLFGVIAWKARTPIHWRPIVGTTLLSIAVAAMLFFSINAVRSQYHPVESVSAKIAFKASEGKLSVSERKAFWLEALELSNDRPLFGYGPYSFRFVQPEIQTQVLATSDHPHNVFLKLGMERGLFSALLFGWILLVIVLHVLRTRLQDRFSVLALTAVLGVLAHNMIDYNLQFVGIALPFWILLALLAPMRSAPDTQPISRRIVIGFLAIALFIVTTTEAVGLFRSSLARRAVAREDASAAAAAFERVEWALFSRDDWLTRSILSLQSENYLQAEAEAQRYIVLNEEDARGFRLLGDIYRAWGQQEDALRAYENAFARSSRNDLGIARGYAELLVKDPVKLKELRPAFDLLLSDFTDAILVNAHFVALSRNVEELDALSRILARVYPEDRGIYDSLRRRALDHAATERDRYTARPRGLLW